MSDDGVTRVIERTAVNVESNGFSGVDTRSNSAKPEQEEKEQDDVQLSYYSGSANVFTMSRLFMTIQVDAAIGFSLP
ncbi:hypothetical protein PInf_021678 [Phytophthora infestans]|nr:hypothetical protein PInf_021678 [Phytophthora infestans]